jgi:integrase
MRGMVKTNPVNQIEPRTRPKAKTRFIPDTTMWYAFLDWLKENNAGVYFFVKFIANTGLRKGEALALRYADLDLINNRICVNKSYSDLEKKVLDHPKTDAGVREVPLFEDALEVLDSIPKEKRPDEIFYMVSKSNITHTFPKLAKRYGLPHLTIHGLRHLFASECSRRGVDKKTYSLWMGHSDTEITDDYTHVTSEFEAEEIKKMTITGHRKKKN